MSDTQMADQVSVECSESNCSACTARAEQEAHSQELSFAFLLALVPAITLSFFANVGLL